MAPPPHLAPRSRRRRRLVSGLGLIMLLLAVAVGMRFRATPSAERVAATLELVETSGHAWTVELQALASPATRQMWQVPAGGTVKTDIAPGTYVARQLLVDAAVLRRQEVEFALGATYRWSLAAVAPSMIWPPQPADPISP